jgi:hypothetical protein
MNIAECEDKIEVCDDELGEMSLESLEQLLFLVNECDDCSGCDGQRLTLKELIAEKEKGVVKLR